MKTLVSCMKWSSVLSLLVILICHSGALFAQKTHHFKPSKFYFTYDAKHEPVLKINLAYDIRSITMIPIAIEINNRKKGL